MAILHGKPLGCIAVSSPAGIGAAAWRPGHGGTGAARAAEGTAETDCEELLIPAHLFAAWSRTARAIRRFGPAGFAVRPGARMAGIGIFAAVSLPALQPISAWVGLGASRGDAARNRA